LPDTATLPASRPPGWPERFCRALEGLMALLLALMVAMVFGNVVLRYAFNAGITVSEELSRWCFVWLTFLGAVVALRERGHLGTDVLVARLPRAGRRLCLGLCQVLMLGVTGVLLHGSVSQTRINWDVDAPVTGLPVAVVYAAGVAFAVPALLLLLIDLWRTLTGQLADDELIGIRESEEGVHTPGSPR
jgi:TRAP-type transport system small permease protein